MRSRSDAARGGMLRSRLLLAAAARRAPSRGAPAASQRNRPTTGRRSSARSSRSRPIRISRPSARSRCCDGRTPAQPARPRPGWLGWMVGLFRWLDQSARLLVWVHRGARRWACSSFSSAASCAARTTTGATDERVRRADARPGSRHPAREPAADIGAAARALWDRGEHRAALALLYRGLLSRLAHVHQRADSRFEHRRRLPGARRAHLPRRGCELRVAPGARLAARGLRPRGRPRRGRPRAVRRLRGGARSAASRRTAAAGAAS